MPSPMTPLPSLVLRPITHLGQAGVTARPRVPDGADVQCIYLLGKSDARGGLTGSRERAGSPQDP